MKILILTLIAYLIKKKRIALPEKIELFINKIFKKNKNES
jgi:hypothetical protein